MKPFSTRLALTFLLLSSVPLANATSNVYLPYREYHPATDPNVTQANIGSMICLSAHHKSFGLTSAG
jgi:hypothetical protein